MSFDISEKELQDIFTNKLLQQGKCLENISGLFMIVETPQFN